MRTEREIEAEIERLQALRPWASSVSQGALNALGDMITALRWVLS